MNILRIYTKLPPNKGGMENHIYYLTREQLNKHRVTVCFNSGDKISKNDIKLDFYNFTKIRPQSLGMCFFYLNIIVLFLIKKHKFDVIHIHGDWSSLIFAKILRNIVCANVVLFSIHGKFSDSFLYKYLLKFQLKKVDHVFSTGYETAFKISQIFDNEKITIQPSGLAMDFYSVPPFNLLEKKYDVITVASLTKQKNIDFILEIAKVNRALKFLIIGDGLEEKNLMKTKKINNLDNVFFHGHRNASYIKKALNISKCFLLTSYEEGTPTVIIEAMSQGLPIITSNVGGIKNIIKNGENGFVIDEFSLNKYSKVLNYFLRNTNLQRKIYYNNTKLSHSYRWNEVEKKITSITERIYHENITYSPKS